ncbi:hypothetical protein [Porphyromonas endodontalis]|jgi:hypothetical protein|uniref:hypothetical protein n=1 Tax=Porphyromonas endodontalis TaxID=28124 RepID=UPI0028EE023A|nr:hypothetical protein [Porphyromonas endodontalis]
MKTTIKHSKQKRKTINFFSCSYNREHSRTDKLFGIVDQGKQAYTTTVNQKDWHASVENKSGRSLIFMPLDHNIVIHPTPDTTYSLCDGMLYNNRSGGLLVFVELKVQDTGWIPKAIEQLKSTIELFRASHNIKQFSPRIAYAANKKHPHFDHSHRERQQEFRKKHKFGLLIQNKIEIKSRA